MWIDYDDGHAGGYPHECERCPTCGLHMDQHLTMWGCAISAQVRRHGILDQEALARDQITVSGLTETVLALHIKADTQRSPEHGQPYLLGSRDMENLRDLLNFATDRGMLQRQLCVSE